MDSVRKKAGYLEGLIQAMQLNEDEPSARLTCGMVELLSQLSDRVEALDDMIAELNDYVESIDDDLCELEGMQDDKDLTDAELEDFLDESPLRLIKSESAAPEPVRIAARCPKCDGVFLAGGALTGKYACPLCQKKIRPERLSDKNTPVAEPEK